VLRRRWQWLREACTWRTLGRVLLGAALIAVNWLLYIWAVQHDHVLDSSLGYFITPLVNVLLGYTLLKERPRRVQWAALAIAALGVVWLTLQTGKLPWIALVLGITFACYGLLRKVAALGPLEGLMLETLVLGPLALAALLFWARAGNGVFPSTDLSTNLWLIALGPITAVPLLMFAAGARSLSMTTLGLLQYIGPTIQFAVGVWVFHEPFTPARLVGFSAIWFALVIYTLDGWRVSRLPPAPA
jgi:chloramphenicol-sensitive protein RarD